MAPSNLKTRPRIKTKKITPKTLNVTITKITITLHKPSPQK